MRRLRRGHILPLIALACAIAPSCAREKPFTKETFVMGTKAWVTIYGLGPEEAEAAASEALRRAGASLVACLAIAGVPDAGADPESG